MIETSEILQTMRMIQEENFDIRTITLGINLLDCSDRDAEKCAQRVYDKICRVAANLVRTGEDIEREFGIPIVNKRISVTPVSLICQADPRPIARALDRAAHEMGVNFLGGYSALTHKGMTLADERLIQSIPDVRDHQEDRRTLRRSGWTGLCEAGGFCQCGGRQSLHGGSVLRCRGAGVCDQRRRIGPRCSEACLGAGEG